MSDFDATRDLFLRGMLAAKAKEYKEARHYLEWALRQNPTNDQRIDILYWLAEATLEPAEKRRCLEEALAYNPGDMRCRRALALLDGQLKAEEIVNPDQVIHPLEAVDPDQAAARRFICPQCGGRMTFAPDGISLTCEYCESRQSLARSTASASSPPKGGSASSPPELRAPEGVPGGSASSPPKGGSAAGAAESFLIAMATRKGHLHPVNRQTFNCQGCGIDFILPAAQLSLTCPYCASAYVVRRPASRELIDPHVILPFAVTENQARAALQDWFTTQSIPPDAHLQVERATGIYLPVWSFEMAGLVPWSCLVQQSRNVWVPENGKEIVYHSSVVVPASPHLTAECAEELRAFDLKQAVPFDERYLADWPAETYSTTLGDASLEARRWTYEFEKNSVRGRFLQPVRDLTFNSLAITIESFKLVLLPVWLTHYQMGAKQRSAAPLIPARGQSAPPRGAGKDRFQLVMNGITGAIRAQRPLSWLEKLLRKSG